MGDMAFDSYQVINENSYSLYVIKDESFSEEVYVKLSDVKFLCTDQQNAYPRKDCYPYEVGMDAIVKYTALKNKLSEQSDKFAEQTKRIEDTLK